MLKRNLIANYLGQGWVAVMGLVFIPLYIKYLGIEAFGLIGLFTLLTTWMNMLDMGMTPTLGREMGRFTGGKKSAHSIHDLLRTIEYIIFGIALLIAASLGLASDWLATEWIKTKAISSETISEAFVIMGFVVAIRFTEGIYRSAIVGLQRQVLFNVISSLLATVRGIGSVLILAWIAPTVQAFFIFQAIMSLLTLVIFANITYHIIPKIDKKAKFSIVEFKQIWKFASGMILITFFALTASQIDKVLISKILSLTEFAYYSLAATIAGSLFLLIAPITQAFYPKFCELYAGNRMIELTDAYHKGAQLVTSIAGSAALIIIFYNKNLCELWGMDIEVAKKIEPIIVLLVLGNLINGLSHTPYQMQLAHGWTNLTLRLSIGSTVVILPTLLLVVPKYGIEGAGWTWIGLTTANLIISGQFMYKNILKYEKLRWYLNDVLLPLSASAVTIIMFNYLFPMNGDNLNQIVQIFISGIAAILASFLSASHIRPYYILLIKKIKNKVKFS
jgi:O-antigen/teichoic acid export membrane protein